ncbi:MAG: hypothetical protein KC931_17145 [Candidatus Omnitrophica bacterium]|nr:hypothetical protein [Candidatus Omnitrophota bacterium]MCA9438213.1 hypothetical protein [Candidatus Omnitrophota bacterium]MCA9439673.1 hypothetical protein [Candidatus Omnitrophota bacterium]MCA9448849.1 hypothetical protein [Candidatus Omnitrophota bacterium]MCB9784251.1 hypothetical protein [Candidatus Omnitrophota bacterium]
MDRSTQDLIAGCVFFVIGWAVAYLVWTKRLTRMSDERNRYLLKMSEDQSDAFNKLAAVFAALVGTCAFGLGMIQPDWGRTEVVRIFYASLLVSPAVLYWKNPPKPSNDESVSARNFFFKNVPRVISWITLVFVFVIPLLAHHHGSSTSFIPIGFFVPLFFFFVSLY